MTTPNLESVKAKVAKLMALSESANPNEAAAALTKARELMIEYQLGEGDVAFTTEKSRITDAKVPNIQTPRQIWETELGTAVAQAFNCKCLFNKYTLFFYGTPEDLEITTYTFEQLRFRIRDMAYHATGQHTEAMKRKYGLESVRGQLFGPEHPKTWRMAYVAGVVDGIKSKLREMMKHDSPEVTTLVVVRHTAVEKYVNEKYAKIRAVDLQMTAGHDGAYNRGYKEGRDMDVRPGIEGHRPDQLTG